MKDEGTEQALKEMVEALFLKPEERGVLVIRERIKDGAQASWGKLSMKRGELIDPNNYRLVHDFGFYAGIEWALKLTEGKP